MKCGSCSKKLGKSTKTHPVVWCTICGWVHNACSGLENVRLYDKNSFTCTKCSRDRVVSSELTNNANFRKLYNLYTDVKNSKTAYGNVKALADASGLSKAEVETFLSTNATYTKFRQNPTKFPRLKVQSYRINEIWSIDLADMQQLSSENKGVRYLLVAVDTLSRFVRVQPQCTKTSRDTKVAFCKMITTGKDRPESVWSDKGTEFSGVFKQYCAKQNIHMYSTFSETKSAFAERNIRSLKALIFRYLHENHTSLYIDRLQDFVKIINSRTNRMTRLAPKDVTKDHTSYLVSLNNQQSIQKVAKFKKGDTVRIRRKIETFHRGYKLQFTHEVFVIAKVLTPNPPTYQIKDESGHIILGRFYEPELVKFKAI